MIEVDGLRAEDYPVWEKLFRGYNEFYGEELTPEIADRAWREFRAGTRMHAFGARLDGELVGFTHFLVHASTTEPDVCYLQDLYTAPEVRGRGVGRALIEAVAEWAKAQECSRVYWHTQETNATARRLYDTLAENRGFIEYVMKF
ncbi:GNAT family N-acetyltransferase [Nocardia terpenica]|uniref:GNAT family N-acetyltransferase n=1 Tax=Nocardia terpenica TaxID=455432 RepID=A0A291RRF1_9NOCA|nr:GNAT family N-acetyltransferase [Nocardia terpenica]ATL70116.1 GNAT family N-acetyltransferase [Nocardia terpenica]